MGNLSCQSATHHSSFLASSAQPKVLRENGNEERKSSFCVCYHAQSQVHHSVVYLETQKLQLLNAELPGAWFTWADPWASHLRLQVIMFEESAAAGSGRIPGSQGQLSSVCLWFRPTEGYIQSILIKTFHLILSSHHLPKHKLNKDQ